MKAEELNAISKAVEEALADYFAWWSTRYHERVYGVALFSTSLVDYLGCTIFSEEGLDAVVSKYQQNPLLPAEDPATSRMLLRWSPCDSPHHMENLAPFEPANDLIRGLPTHFRSLEGEAFGAEVEAVYEALCAGIRAFRSRVFGEDRSDIVTTMLWGDVGSDELERFVRLCSAPAAAERFLMELGAP